MVDQKALVYSRLGIPRNFWNARLDVIPDTCPHKAIVQSYVDNICERVDENQGLYLYGDYSRGKSAIGCILLKAVFHKCKKVGFWIRCGNLAEAYIKETPYDGHQTLIDRALSVPFLVLDELVVNGDRRDVYAEELIRERSNAALCTVITTNYSPKKIQDKFPALHAVLLECVTPVEVEGKDFRRDIGIAKAEEIQSGK